MTITGYTPSTRAALGIGAGVVTAKVGANEYTRLGVTTGGLQFNNGKVIKSVNFDGLISMIRGLDYVAGFAPVISCTFKEFSVTLLQYLEYGIAFNGASPNILTPKPAMTLFADSNVSYLDNLRFLFALGDGTTWESVVFPAALPKYTGYQSKDKDEADLPVTFEARLVPAGSPLDLTATPYKLEKVVSPVFT